MKRRCTVRPVETLPDCTKIRLQVPGKIGTFATSACLALVRRKRKRLIRSSRRRKAPHSSHDVITLRVDPCTTPALLVSRHRHHDVMNVASRRLPSRRSTSPFYSGSIQSIGCDNDSSVRIYLPFRGGYDAVVAIVHCTLPSTTESTCIHFAIFLRGTRNRYVRVIALQLLVVARCHIFMGRVISMNPTKLLSL